MFEIGKYCTLTVDRIKPPGAFLINDNDDDILLPNKYIPDGTKVGDDLDVFIYLDISLIIKLMPILLDGYNQNKGFRDRCSL